MLLYAMLALCAVAVGAIVYRYDLYDREPLVLLAVATGAGAGMMWLAGKAEAFWLVRVWPEHFDNDSLIAVLAGTHEETAKLAVVVLMAVAFRARFNDPMDGLIYGSFAGLGAAVEESFDVLRFYAPATLPPQEPVRLMGHLIMGGIGAAGLGLWTRGVKPARSLLAATTTFAAAVVIHIAWDLVALPAQKAGVMTGPRTVAAVGVMVGGLIGYAALVVFASRASRRRFDPGSRRRVWGWPFTSPGSGER